MIFYYLQKQDFFQKVNQILIKSKYIPSQNTMPVLTWKLGNLNFFLNFCKIIFFIFFSIKLAIHKFNEKMNVYNKNFI